MITTLPNKIEPFQHSHSFLQLIVCLYIVIWKLKGIHVRRIHLTLASIFLLHIFSPTFSWFFPDMWFFDLADLIFRHEPVAPVDAHEENNLAREQWCSCRAQWPKPIGEEAWAPKERQIVKTNKTSAHLYHHIKLSPIIGLNQGKITEPLYTCS